ncbi:UDP-glucose dehydrogenase family protein [Candidatus Auribacterota bacterium]
MKVSIIGAGYVGLVTGVCFAELGHHVMCVDNNKDKINMLKAGRSPIYEPGLEALIKKNTKNKRLVFSESISRAVKFAPVIFVAVNTPPKADGTADLSYVAAVSKEIALTMDGYRLIVDKSTVPVHTGEKVAETIKRYNKHNVDFDVASNPEFLREGSAIDDTLRPDRIVIGVSCKRASKLLREIYEPIKAHVLETDIKSAEIIKHASNSFLAMKISFANCLAHVCELAGADIEEVVNGMGLDKRIGKRFLNAGIGYGGSCFPKDVAAFISISNKLGYDFKLLKNVEEVNVAQRDSFIKKVEDTLWVVKDKKIGVLGLAFKPNTDDMRSAPSIYIINRLKEEGAHIKAYDPQAMPNAKKEIKGISYGKNPYDLAKGADALLVLTEWDEFKDIDLEKIRSLMVSPIIIDGRNIFEKDKMEAAGFIYKSIGR